MGQPTVGSNPTPSASGSRGACHRPPGPPSTPTRVPTVTDDEAMNVALEQASLAASLGEVPVGAVVAVDGEIIAAAHNLRESTVDPTAHAEVVALRAAGQVLGTWRLSAATLYVTLEPCAMCAGAAVSARLGRLVYGAPDSKAGAVGSLYNLASDPRLNHEVPWVSGVRAQECAAVLEAFFAERR